MKKTKNIFLAVGSLTIALAPLSTMISCGKTKQNFWNYEDYIDGDIQKGIKNNFNYKMFGDLPEFENALNLKKAAGGIGSDYFNANLAEKKLIKKIDFTKMFGIEDKTKWEEELQKIYTPEAWKVLTLFNGEWDSETGIDYLWEYTVPYFMQNKVIAINPYKITETTENKSFLDILKDGDQEDIQTAFTDLTYKGILTKLKANGFTKLAVNDYMRDNLMIGSENGNAADFTSVIPNQATANSHLDGFKSLINTFGKNNTSFETSGVENIAKLLNTKSGTNPYGNDQISFAYNGDALFAYNGLSEDNYKAGEIRIINPANSSFLMDGFVIASHINSSVEEKMYETAKTWLYAGFDKKSDASNFETDNRIYQNFDYVNYTPAFENTYEYVMDGYFADENSEDLIAKKILAATRDSAGTNVINIKQNTVTTVISGSIFSDIKSKYDSYKSSK